MSDFAYMVRNRLSSASSDGRLTNPSRNLDGRVGDRAVVSGRSLVERLISTNVACARDKDCTEVLTVLKISGQGTPADKRTALTRLQRLLENLTAADSDVAGDLEVQKFRRSLHLALDH